MSQALCAHFIDQNSVTCPHLTVRRAGKMGLSRKGTFDKPIALCALGFCRFYRAMLFNVVATSHSQTVVPVQDEGRASRARLGQVLTESC